MNNDDLSDAGTKPTSSAEQAVIVANAPATRSLEPLHSLSTGRPGEQYQLASPLWVCIERDDDQYIISDDTVLEMFGSGNTLEAARHDYGVSVLEYHRILREREADGCLGK